MEIQKKLVIDYRAASLLFEKAMKKFQVKKIVYKTLFRGKGLEFDGYRNFDPEEDVSSIDWKATLRSGQKMSRQYKEERDLNVYFLVDCSKGMLFGSGKKLKAEYIGELVCVLSHLVLVSGDNVGLIMYSDKAVKLVRPSNSKSQISIIHKFLSDINNYSSVFELGGALEFSSRFMGGISNNLIILSDFIHIKKGFDRGLKLSSSRTDLFAIMVRDFLDEELPEDSYNLVVEDPATSKRLTINTEFARRRYNLNANLQKQKVKKLFSDSGIDLLELRNSQEFALPLSTFMKRRAEELRI